jgi:hypothetical protein
MMTKNEIARDLKKILAERARLDALAECPAGLASLFLNVVEECLAMAGFNADERAAIIAKDYAQRAAELRESFEEQYKKELHS